jgi:hypothetical protein
MVKYRRRAYFGALQLLFWLSCLQLLLHLPQCSSQELESLETHVHVGSIGVQKHAVEPTSHTLSSEQQLLQQDQDLELIPTQRQQIPPPPPTTEECLKANKNKNIMSSEYSPGFRTVVYFVNWVST